MVRSEFENRIRKEDELLTNELMPELEEALNGYKIMDLEDEVDSYLQGDVDYNDYELPRWNNVVVDPSSGYKNGVLPSGFVVEESKTKEDIKNGDYAAAFDPLDKVLQIKDEDVREELLEFAEKWESRTYIKEVPVDGDADNYDVSEVTLLD
ncbi:MAG: hypothetical protein SVV03_00890 [Candidatus Nanohaloarchaea archaeon]|nr:hypothetical protein [Candidatus Nanohaloarchaea archaeon]